MDNVLETLRSVLESEQPHKKIEIDIVNSTAAATLQAMANRLADTGQFKGATPQEYAEKFCNGFMVYSVEVHMWKIKMIDAILKREDEVEKK